MTYTILNLEGKELYATVLGIEDLTEDEIAVEELRTEHMENPYFDFVTRTFYDKLD